jgi:hypothetical protein
MSIGALVCELAKQDPCRPLRVTVDLDDGWLKRDFKSSESAVHWLRRVFNCEVPPSPTGSTHSRDEQEMAITSHLDEELVCHATMNLSMMYMWADAGLLPGVVVEANPMRWSDPMTPEEVVNDLEAAECRDRPVKVKVDMPGHHEVRIFESTKITVQWICTTFKVPDDKMLRLKRRFLQQFRPIGADNEA